MESINEFRNKICRLCLKNHNELNNIFDENDESIQNDISKYIYLFFAVEITKSDPYSTYVCKPCWDIIVSMCKYRLRFRKNDTLLRDSKSPVPQGLNSVKLKFKVTPRCHESVKKLFVKYKKIKISQALWATNLNPKVVLSKIIIPKQEHVSDNDELNESNSNAQIIPINKLKPYKTLVQFSSLTDGESNMEQTSIKHFKTEN